VRCASAWGNSPVSECLYSNSIPLAHGAASAKVSAWDSHNSLPQSEHCVLAVLEQE